MLELCRFLMVEVIFLISLTFHMTERKGSPPDPFQQGCLVTLTAYLPERDLSWNVWNVELCLVSSTGTSWGQFIHAPHPGLNCGFQECWGWCNVIQHWCLTLPCIKWGLTRAAPPRTSSQALGSCNPLQMEAIPWWGEMDGSHGSKPSNRLLSRSHILSPFSHGKCVSRVTCRPAPLDPMQWLLKLCFNNNKPFLTYEVQNYLHRLCEWNRAHRPKGDDGQEQVKALLTIISQI